MTALGLTLPLYLARRYFSALALMIGGLLAIAFLFDTIELLRRAADRPQAGLGEVLTMAILKLPEVGQQLIQFAVLFAALATFWQLTRRHELEVVRGAGVSAWLFVAPICAVAVVTGIFAVTVINPIGSVLLERYQTLEARLLSGQQSAIDLSASGLWLRQTDGTVETVIHARTVDPESWALAGVVVFRFGPDDTLLSRIDAPAARLADGYWDIRDAMDTSAAGAGTPVPRMTIPTELTATEIEDSFASPITLSFWYLPRFITTLEATGFPATRARLFFQSLLATPLLYASLVLLAAAVALRPPRHGNVLGMVAAGLGLGFMLFFIGDVVEALALSGTLPPLLAAWIPALAALLFGLAALLYQEEG